MYAFVEIQWQFDVIYEVNLKKIELNTNLGSTMALSLYLNNSCHSGLFDVLGIPFKSYYFVK